MIAPCLHRWLSSPLDLCGWCFSVLAQWKWLSLSKRFRALLRAITGTWLHAVLITCQSRFVHHETFLYIVKTLFISVQIAVSLSEESAMAEAEEFRCFVGGLSWSTTDKGLEDAFRSFGNVLEAKVSFYIWRCSCISPRAYQLYSPSTMFWWFSYLVAYVFNR